VKTAEFRLKRAKQWFGNFALIDMIYLGAEYYNWRLWVMRWAGHAAR
jgi:hypothetical protein